MKFLQTNLTSHGKEMDNTTIGNSYWKNEEISGWEPHINTQKPVWNVLIITDVFFDQKRVNVCEHMVKTISCVVTEIINLQVFIEILTF